MKRKYQLDIRMRHRCLTCKQMGRPLKRVWGFPSSESLIREAEGRIALMGCCLELNPAQYECRHCGTDWRIVRL